MKDWRQGVVVIVLLATTYVQSVGKNVELLSGLDRLKNLRTYRFLFGGPPWIAWLMFRWGGIIQVAGLILVFVWFGWKAMILTAITVLMFAVLTWRVARRHALEMFRDVQKRIEDETISNSGFGPP